MGMRWLVVWWLGALVACSGSAEIESSGAGAGGASSSAGGSGGTAGSSAQTGGSGGEAGMGGGPDCPDIDCAKTCPAGTWPELDNCPSCACASTLEMVIAGQPKPLQHVTFTPAVTDFIGAIDRWIFDLTWLYDDPMASDDTEVVVAQVAIMRLDPQYEPSPQNASWCYPEDTGMPFEDRGATYTLLGIGVFDYELMMTDGFLSIRRNGDQFEGHVYFDFTSTDGPPVHVAAPFVVPVP